MFAAAEANLLEPQGLRPGSTQECAKTVVKVELDIEDNEPPFEAVTSKAQSNQTADKRHSYHHKSAEVVIKVEHYTGDTVTPKLFTGDWQADCGTVMGTPQSKLMEETRHNSHYQECPKVVIKVECDTERKEDQEAQIETATDTPWHIQAVEEVPIEWEEHETLNKEEKKIISTMVVKSNNTPHSQLFSPKAATLIHRQSSDCHGKSTYLHYRRPGRPMTSKPRSQQSESSNFISVSDLSCIGTRPLQKPYKSEPFVDEKTKKKPFDCQHCEYSASNKRYLKTHMRTHTGERPYKCYICDYSATEQGNLQRHMRIHTGEKPFKCAHCDYSGSQHTALQMHMRRHLGDKRYKCEYCDYSTYGTSILQRHMRVHTGEKPFNCELCDYRTSQCSTLQTHMRTHTGEKPFKCEHCGYSASQHSTLKKHTLVHTKETPFKCDLCHYRAALRSTLQKHMKCTHGISVNNRTDSIKI